MKKAKIPSFLGILILLIAVISIIFIMNSASFFNSGAKDNSLSPQDVKVTNITDASFTVTWITDTQTIGFVEYSSTDGGIKSIPTTNSKTHLITIKNLNPATSYTFKINSGGTYFDNNSNPWTTTTLSSQLASESSQVSGKIVNANNFPAKDALIFVSLNNNTYSAKVTESGNWVISIPKEESSSIIQILVESSVSEIASAQIQLKDANPVPTISLGKSYDFRNEENNPSLDAPKLELTLP